ncbi:MAG TPA: hypothetical protein P5026_07110 [Kiritimatiellia bacterium]|nr:hypothetical protein [Kiritimatiellia bacterium]HRU70350.1 hypothetical protein [Kiritimatiellia bacterium]
MKSLCWIVACWMSVPWFACGWGGGHDVVARAVAARLPEPWRTVLQGERLPQFCRDNHFPDARVTFADEPRVTTEEQAFLAARGMQNSGAFHSDEGRAVAFTLLTWALRDNRVDSVSLWLGTLAHSTADMVACNHDPIVHLATYGWSDRNWAFRLPNGKPLGGLDLNWIESMPETRALWQAHVDQVVAADSGRAAEDALLDVMLTGIRGVEVCAPLGLPILQHACAWFGQHDAASRDTLASHLSVLGGWAVTRTLNDFLTAQRLSAGDAEIHEVTESIRQRYREACAAFTVSRRLHDDSLTKGLTDPQYPERPFIGVVVEPTWRMDEGMFGFNDRVLAAQAVHHLRRQFKNAALIDVRTVMAEGLDVTRTPQVMVFAQRTVAYFTLKPAVLTDRLVAYRKAGGKIIWVGGAPPDRRLCDFPAGVMQRYDPGRLWYSWTRLPVATNAYATLSLQAGAWPRRRLVRDPCFEAGWHIPSNTTLFMSDATTWVTPLVTLFDRETPHVVGAAWPKDAPTVAYLPTYAVYPFLWTDAKPSLVPLSLDLDAQGFEGLDLAFAALHGPVLPPSAFVPPPDLGGASKAYRSPLLFADGTPVRDAAEWPRRRQEILREWHDRMGAWPPLITNQVLHVQGRERCEGFERRHVRFNWLPEESTDGYLLVPDGEGQRPAVVTVFYEPETAVGIGGKPYRDFALQLARRGFVTLSIGTREASARHEFSLYWPSLQDAKVQPLSMLAYAAANAYQVLVKEACVDPARVGIVGHSFGGKWAMFASCLYDRFACAVWSDPGIVFGEDRPSINYWEPWYLGYHPKPWRARGLMTPENPGHGLYPELREAGLDLTDLHALMAPRPFLVSGGAEDPPGRWAALRHAIRVNALLGATNRVAMTNRLKHDPCAESNEQIYRFFEQMLRP